MEPWSEYDPYHERDGDRPPYFFREGNGRYRRIPLFPQLLRRARGHRQGREGLCGEGMRSLSLAKSREGGYGPLPGQDWATLLPCRSSHEHVESCPGDGRADEDEKDPLAELQKGGDGRPYRIHRLREVFDSGILAPGRR